MSDIPVQEKRIVSVRRNQFEGMVYEIEPKTTTFREWLRSPSNLRTYNMVSSRLSNLLKTVSPEADKDTALKIKAWLDDLFANMNGDISNFEKVVSNFESNAQSQKLYGSMYFSSEPTRLSYSHPIMISVIKALDKLNDVSLRIETVWMKGEMNDVSHTGANSRLMKPLEIFFERVISATDVIGRKGAKYDPNYFQTLYSWNLLFVLAVLFIPFIAAFAIDGMYQWKLKRFQFGKVTIQFYRIWLKAFTLIALLISAYLILPNIFIFNNVAQLFPPLACLILGIAVNRLAANFQKLM